MRNLNDEIKTHKRFIELSERRKTLNDELSNISSEFRSLASQVIREFFQGVIPQECSRFTYYHSKGNSVYTRDELIEIFIDNAEYAWDAHATTILYLGDGVFKTYQPASNEYGFEFRIEPFIEKEAER